MAAPRTRKQPETRAADEAPFDEEVFDKLRALRTELARETRVPPYVVFHDATLRELARALPRDERSFLAVKGAGPGRWQRYGDRVVAITGAALAAPAPEAVPLDATPSETTPVVREAEEQRWFGFTPAPAGAPSASRASGLAVKSALPRSGIELWALCASGATLGEICTRLGRTVADVASELADAAGKGKALDVGRLLGAQRVEAIKAASLGANGDVVAVRRRLTFPAALAEIRLALTTP